MRFLAEVDRGRATPLRGIGLLLLSMFFFAVVDALGKVVALRYPANEVTFFRMFFGLIPALAACLRRPFFMARLRSVDVRGQTTRALTLLGASTLFFAGLPYLPLSEAVAIVYSEALFVIVLAPFLLGEKLRPANAIAALVGFIGVLFVVRPHGSLASWIGPVLLIASALFGALSMIQIRRIRRSDDSGTTVLFFTVLGTLITGASLAIAWRTPSIGDLALMALLGVFATMAQLLFTVAVRGSNAANLAPYTYTSIVWATAFGYILWGETLSVVAITGVALIVGSSIAVAIREQPPEGPAL